MRLVITPTSPTTRPHLKFHDADVDYGHPYRMDNNQQVVFTWRSGWVGIEIRTDSGEVLATATAPMSVGADTALTYDVVPATIRPAA